MTNTRVHPLVAAGFTLLVAGIVAHLGTGEWLWTAGGAACLFVSAVWASAFTPGSEGKRDE